MQKIKSVALVLLSLVLLVSCDKQAKVVILHTNDTHSQVEPKADGTCGYARRMGLIAQERKANPDLFLFDAGDFCQGTPYFNYYGGRVEVEALNYMRYDAVTLGNHEFDNGLDSLAMLIGMLNCPVVCANYDPAGTVLEGLLKPYVVIERAGVRVGVMGLGVNPEGLIAMKNFLPMHYLDPLPVADSISTLLRDSLRCDLIVCLSHLGTQYENGKKVSDEDVAAATRNIDVIIGGHTHKMFPDYHVKNADGRDVLLSQMGKSCAAIGKIEIELSNKQ